MDHLDSPPRNSTISRTKRKLAPIEIESPQKVPSKKCKSEENVSAVYLSVDSLITVFSFCPFEDILTFRLVCRYWRETASSNALWVPIYKRDFGEDPPETSKFSAFYSYLDIIRRIPRITHIDPHSKSEDSGDDTEVGLYVEYSVADEMLLMKLDCTADQVDFNVHRLAALLSFLAVNQYCPKLCETMRVGKGKDYVEIPVSKFCFKVLQGKENDLWKNPEERGGKSL